MTVWYYADDINTDMLFPGKYTYTCSTSDEIEPHLLEDLDPSFAKKVQTGDYILAGKNFGCGSSREQPVIGLKSVGIQAIVAKSFARIFYRAGLNQGLMLIESPEAIMAYKKGDNITVDVKNGSIKINDQMFSFPALPARILAIRNAGGLLPYTREKLREKKD